MALEKKQSSRMNVDASPAKKVSPVRQAPFQQAPRIPKEQVPRQLPFDASQAMIAMTLQNTTFKKTKVVHKGQLISLKQ